MSGDGNGPTVNAETKLDYVLDKPLDPVSQQYFDQAGAAADDVRAAFGIVPDGTRKIPTQRAWKALSEMWARLVAESEHDVCTHIADRPLQPIAVIPDERRQLCLPCASEWTFPPTEGVDHACPGCGDVESLTTIGDPTGSLWAHRLQWQHYVSLFVLCAPCRNLLIHEREGLPIDLEMALRESRGGAANDFN